MDRLADQRILILGAGLSGLAMARWCVRHGAQVVVADTRQTPQLLATLSYDVPQARFASGALGEHLLTAPLEIDRVCCSPGLLPQQVDALLQAAAQRQIAIGGELGLFVQALQDLKRSRAYQPAVLAITGTNGKTTVTSLTGRLVEAAGKTVAVAGNIGPTLLDTLSACLESGDLPDVWVLELSSFQLARDAASGFDPTAATVLNITQDHLDWHPSMQDYADAKRLIFGSSATVVLNRDDAPVNALLSAKDCEKRTVVSFGLDEPRAPGDFGLEVVRDMTWMVRAEREDLPLKRKKSAAPIPQGQVSLQRLMPAEALRIRGLHNAANAMAALALALCAGCPLAPMLYALRQYQGEPHRVEPVCVIGGVEYFDDSKGTNVGATVAALGGLGAQRRIVLILGGQGKGQDFAPLAQPIRDVARAVVLIGQDAALIREAIAQTGVALVQAHSMPQAVREAARLAQPGDAVLLSPACASLDMFKDYAHRAEAFRAEVAVLAEQQAGGLT